MILGHEYAPSSCIVYRSRGKIAAIMQNVERFMCFILCAGYALMVHTPWRPAGYFACAKYAAVDLYDLLVTNSFVILKSTVVTTRSFFKTFVVVTIAIFCE